MDDAVAKKRKLAHDLRGGLNRIRLAVGVLEGETDPAEVVGWLDVIIQATDDVVRHLEAAGVRFDADAE